MRQLINLRFATFVTIATLTFGLMACSSDEEARTEITVPAGSLDFFSKTVTFDSPASEKSFTFTTNKSWTVSVADTRDGSSWCTVSPTKGEPGTNTVSIRVADNTTYDERNAVVTLTANDSIRKIFVSQKQLDAILLSSNRAEVPVAGGTIDIEVKANIDYSVSISEDAKSWIHQTTTGTRGLTSSTLSFSVDKSEEYDKREGKIIFKSGSKEEFVTVYQVGEGILSLSQNTFNISSEAQELSIEINSNFDYQVELPQVDWISEIKSSTRGISTHTLRLAIKESDEYDARSAIVKIKDKNSSLEEAVSITQAARGGILIVSQKEYLISSEAQELAIEINSNFDYQVELPKAGWIKEVASSTRGVKQHTLKLAISESEEYDSRTATIKIKDANSELEESVVITQVARGGLLIVPQKEYNLSSASQELTVELSSNFDITVEMPEVDWIHEVKSRTRGMSTHTLKFSIAENNDFSSRTAKIRVYDNKSSVSEDISITQSEKQVLEIDNKEFSFDENGGEFTVTVTSNVDYQIKVNADWITKANTRSLNTNSYTFRVSAMTDNVSRQGIVTFSDDKSGLSVDVTVNRKRYLYFNITELTMMEGGILQLNLKNNSGQSVKWSSSNNAVAQVNQSGQVTAISKGTAIISVKTTDGSHSCDCMISVKDITDFVTMARTGIGTMVTNYGARYSVTFTIRNSSSETIHIVSLAGVTDGVEQDLPGHDSVSITLSSSTSFIQVYKQPLIYRFNGKEYTIYE